MCTYIKNGIFGVLASFYLQIAPKSQSSILSPMQWLNDAQKKPICKILDTQIRISLHITQRLVTLAPDLQSPQLQRKCMNNHPFRPDHTRLDRTVLPLCGLPGIEKDFVTKDFAYTPDYEYDGNGFCASKPS